MVVRIWAKEQQKLSGLKELDIQQCSFCQKITILNLGWGCFEKLHCQACQEVHVLCPKLCLPVARNIFGCHLFQEYKPVDREIVPVNKPYDSANCYLCGKELVGASKKGVVKNRNNPSFWGISSSYKILCLKCVGRKYYGSMSKGKQRTFNKYVKRGYV